MAATVITVPLFKMGGVEVQEFLDQPSDLAAYGLDAPVARVTVRAKGDSWIELGEKDGDYYARRSADDAVLKLDYYTVMALSTISAFLVLLCLILMDVMYAVVDPRISYD